MTRKEIEARVSSGMPWPVDRLIWVRQPGSEPFLVATMIASIAIPTNEVDDDRLAVERIQNAVLVAKERLRIK